MSKKIVIIGAGQLGSRHLQGIAQNSFDISIEIVEPFESSRKTEEERYYQIENRQNVKSIEFYDSIDKLSNNIDLVIVATGADVRSKVIVELLSKKNVANLILEKVLFQTVKEYSDIETILNDTNTQCWVNHPRRMFPFYKELKEELKHANQISYSFQGGTWGIGCNALHFIDHLAYLSGQDQLQLTHDLLDHKIYDSKRTGFVEFNGLLVGKIKDHSFSLYSNEKELPPTLTISSDILIIKVEEGKGKIQIAKKENDWIWEEFDKKIVYFQSELSNILLEDILIKEKCHLPTYEEAMNLHVPFIQCLLNHMEKVSGDTHIVCPIT